MRRKAGLASALVAVLSLLLLAGPVRAQADAMRGPLPPEPAGYRMENYLAPTPAALRGAEVIGAAQAHAQWQTKSTIFIDAMPHVPKPANLPAGTIWRGKPRFNIPGSAWLADVGYGALSGERDAYFRRHLQRLTGGDKSRPLVFYCKAHCWMSWNAAKRAIEEYGYVRVQWFPDGTEAWGAAGYPLEEDQPE